MIETYLNIASSNYEMMVREYYQSNNLIWGFNNFTLLIYI